MINLKFDNTCPFCKSHIEKHYIFSHHQCWKCTSHSECRYIKFYYTYNLIQSIHIIMNDNFAIDAIIVNFYKDNCGLSYNNQYPYINNIFRTKVLDYVPDFDCIQDLLTIIQTIELFS